MEYSKKDDWQINKNVMERLVRAWIDTSRLKICTTKGNVDIKGDLEFTGQAKASIDSPIVIISMLKKIDSALKGIPKVRLIKYDFSSWKKAGAKWEYNPGREQQKEDELKESEGSH